jgi:hypothetical protein
MKMIRTYSELIQLKTFEERYNYLKLYGRVGETTFGYDRYINQLLYTSDRWRRTRRGIIIRDNGCDLGMEDHEINDIIIVHHMNPLTIEDIEEERPEIFDQRFLISTTDLTHKAIHYGDENLLPKPFVERRRNDTCPWRQ